MSVTSTLTSVANYRSEIYLGIQYRNQSSFGLNADPSSFESDIWYHCHAIKQTFGYSIPVITRIRQLRLLGRFVSMNCNKIKLNCAYYNTNINLLQI